MPIDWNDPDLVFLRRDLLAGEYDDRAIRRRVRSGEWHRIRRGAFCQGEIWVEADTAARHRLTARAVMRTAHPSAVLSHTSSLVERGVPVWNVELADVHLTRTDGRSGRHEAGVVHHRGRLNEWEVEMVNGLRVTSSARAVVELTGLADVESSLVSANWVLAQAKCSRPELAAVTRRFAHWPNTLTSDLVVRLAEPRCQWPGEARTEHLLRTRHLPSAEPQYEVYDEAGNLVAVVDFAWPDLGVFLEFDGKIKYERLRREGESVADVIQREKHREELVCLLTGWICIRITWPDLARPEQTARRIRALLDSRRQFAA
jgi:hypothetical protein